jgi:hypothetical protein
MNRILIFLVLLSIIFFTNCEKKTDETCGIEVYKEKTIQKYNILLIGNSLTIYNSLFEIIMEVSKSNGDSVFVLNRSSFGWSLKNHCESKETLDAINSKKWDYVVIQGTGAGSAVKPANVADTTFYKYALFLADKIKLNSKNTRIILYMTFASKYGASTFNDTLSCQKDPLVCDFDGMQERIKENTIALSGIIDAEVAPAGIMGKILLKENPSFELYDPDKVHPSPLGSYACALSIYAVICRKSVKGVYIPKNLVKEDAAIVQNTIYNSLFNCNPSWIDY